MSAAGARASDPAAMSAIATAKPPAAPPAATRPAVPGGPSRPGINPWLVAIIVTIATFMEILDTSIANVSLPHIAGSLGTDQDQATWVLTSYLVANAVVLPLSAWLSRICGRKNFYMGCVALFHPELVPLRHCAQSRDADFVSCAARRRRRRVGAERASHSRRHVPPSQTGGCVRPLQHGDRHRPGHRAALGRLDHG